MPGATTGNYNDLANKPTLSTVATSGSYSDLTNKPTIGNGAIYIQDSEGRGSDNFNVNTTTSKTITVKNDTAYLLRHDDSVLFQIDDNNNYLTEGELCLCGFNSSDAIVPIHSSSSNGLSGYGINPFKGFVIVTGKEKLHVPGNYTFRQRAISVRYTGGLQDNVQSPVYYITDMWNGTDVSVDGISYQMDNSIGKLSILIGWWDGKGVIELWPVHPMYYYDGSEFLPFCGNIASSVYIGTQTPSNNIGTDGDIFIITT